MCVCIKMQMRVYKLTQMSWFFRRSNFHTLLLFIFFIVDRYLKLIQFPTIVFRLKNISCMRVECACVCGPKLLCIQLSVGSNVIIIVDKEIQFVMNLLLA